MRKLDPTQTVVTVIQSFMPASVTMSGAFADGQKKVSWQASVAMVSLDPVEAGFADRLTDPRQVQNHKLLLEIGLEAGQTNGYAYTSVLIRQQVDTTLKSG